MRIFIRLFTIFFVLVSTVVAIGFVLLTIQNYTVKEVELIELRSSRNIKEEFYFIGKVAQQGKNLIIKADVDKFIYRQMLNETGGLRKHNISYIDKETLLTMPARFLKYTQLNDHYEFIYGMDVSSYNKYEIDEEVILTMLVKKDLENVIPKTAMIPPREATDESICYIYVVEPKKTFLGTISIIRKKSAKIIYSGHEFASIKILDDIEGDVIFMVNNVDISLKDGMRVKEKWKSF